MRRLPHALVLLTACKTVSVPAPVTVGPGSTIISAPAGAVASGDGAPTPRAAVETYLAAAKAQDIQAMSSVWGDETGSIRKTRGRDEVEKRAIIVSCFLKTSTATVGEPSRGEGARLLVPTTLTQGKVSASPKFTVTQGPGQRWFVMDFDMTLLQNRGFCPTAPK